MKKFLLILTLVVMALSGCVDKGLDAKDPKALMADSGKNLSSYRFVTETVQEIRAIENSTEAPTIAIRSLDEGAVNLTAQNMSISTRKNASSGLEALPSMQRDIYIIRDMAKIKLDGSWSQASLQDPKYFWARQNISEKQAMSLNQSKLALSGSGMVDGLDCNLINVTPDMQAYESMLFEQLGSMLPLDYINFTKLYNSSDVNWTLWISKDDGMLRLENVEMVFSVTPDMIELPSDQIGDFLIKIKLNATTHYGDYNQPVVITLPEGQMLEPIIQCACNR